MSPVSCTPTIDPSTLDADARHQLVDRLYEVQRDVFDGVERDRFAQYVVNSPAERTAIRVYRDHVGRPIGYIALHFFERPLDDARALIIRGEVGFRRAFRGRSLALPFALREMLSASVRWRGGPVYFLACPIHPVSYWVLARNVKTLYPNVAAPTPPGYESLLLDLADDFGLPRVNQGDPLVRHVGWRTRETEAERRRLRGHRSAPVRYYLERNPGYGAGHGLLTLVPYSLGNALSAVFNVSTRPLRRLRRTLLAPSRRASAHAV